MSIIIKIVMKKATLFKDIAVSSNVKFMGMRLKHWDKDEVHRAFPQFGAEYT
jgi:hypothetical protein